MFYHARSAIALLLVTSSAIPLRAQVAQVADSVQREVRVRVEFASTEGSHFWHRGGQSMIGTTVPNGGDTLLLMLHNDAAPIRIPRASIRELYVSQGRTSRWSSAIRGAIAPALIGAALSAATASIRRKAGDPGPGQAALTSAIWGGASGAALGAWSPEERWQRLSSDQRLRSDRAYSAGVSP